MLATDAIPFLSKDVITRPDTSGILIFQVRTDEMHFISENAFALLALCNGSRTISEIEELIINQQPESAAEKIKAGVDKFLESLIERRVLELWS